MSIIKKTLFIFLCLVLISACNSNEDTNPFEFTAAELIQIHNGDQKVWGVAAFYENFSSNIKSEMEFCVLDDVYNFTSEDGTITVDEGDISCFFESPDFEFATASYVFNPESGSVFIDFSIIESKGSASDGLFFTMRLLELSTTRMVFVSGTEEGSFLEAIVFEAN